MFRNCSNHFIRSYATQIVTPRPLSQIEGVLVNFNKVDRVIQNYFVFSDEDSPVKLGFVPSVILRAEKDDPDWSWVSSYWESRLKKMVMLEYSFYLSSENGNEEKLKEVFRNHIHHLKQDCDFRPDAEFKDGIHETPLKLAVSHKAPCLTSTLIEAADSVDDGALLKVVGGPSRIFSLPKEFKENRFQKLKERTIEVLIQEGGVDPNKGTGIDRCTALWKSAYYGESETVKTLAAFGADPNQKINSIGDHFCTPLMAAVNIGSLETVKTLLDLGADSLVTNKIGQTAERYARDVRMRTQTLMRSQVRQEIADLLQQKEEEALAKESNN